MKKALVAATCILVGLGSIGAPALANDGKNAEAIAGALAILGAAALLHHEGHYRDGAAPQTGPETADFERGYRDGLHNADYDSARSSAAYGNGFDAGHNERQNRLIHRSRVASEGPSVLPIAMQGCAEAIAANYSRVGFRDVHIVRTVQRGPNDFLIEGAVGHNHMTCVMGGGGQVNDLYGGRIE